MRSIHAYWPHCYGCHLAGDPLTWDTRPGYEGSQREGHVRNPGCPTLEPAPGLGVSSPGFSPPGPRWHPSRRVQGDDHHEERSSSGLEAGAPRFRASVWGNPSRSCGYQVARSRPSATPNYWAVDCGPGTRNRVKWDLEKRVA